MYEKRKAERKTSSVLIIAKHLSIRSNTEGASREPSGETRGPPAHPTLPGGRLREAKVLRWRVRKGKERLAETCLATYPGGGVSSGWSCRKACRMKLRLSRSLPDHRPLASGGLNTDHCLSALRLTGYGTDTDRPKTNRPEVNEIPPTPFLDRVGPDKVGNTPKKLKTTHRTCKKENEDNTMEDLL